jgi:putative acetyltransferase
MVLETVQSLKNRIIFKIYGQFHYGIAHFQKEKDKSEFEGESLAMIRELRKADINIVADIWLDTNIKAHYFIPAQYWKRNLEFVKELLLQANVYVYENNYEIQGFIGMNGEYIEGIFVSEAMQSQGIGKILLNYVKDTRSKLLLNVYQKNIPAISFIREKDLRFSIAVWMKLPGKKIM